MIERIQFLERVVSTDQIFTELDEDEKKLDEAMADVVKDIDDIETISKAVSETVRLKVDRDDLRATVHKRREEIPEELEQLRQKFREVAGDMTIEELRRLSE